MKKSFVRDYTKILNNRQEMEEDREKPVLVGSILDQQPLSVLERLIKMWPTHDIRYHGYGTLDDKLVIDMIKSAEIRVVKKDITQGIIEITVELVKNIDEVERYNAAVKKHNRDWVKNGSQMNVFDPVHGESFEVRDNYVDQVLLQSSHYSLPDSVYNNTSSGKLASIRPGLNRKSHLRVVYQMSITQDNKFVLGYAAYDYENRIVYYNEVTHHNLAYLVRRSVQEIWGNPLAPKEIDNLLEGVSMLINGRKLSICKKDNKFPEFLEHEKSTIKSTRAIENVELKENINAQASVITGNVVPIFIIIGFIICLLWSFFIMAIDDYPLLFGPGISGGGLESLFYLFLEVLFKLPVVVCILLFIATLFFRKVSQETDRKASELKAHGRFL